MPDMTGAFICDNFHILRDLTLRSDAFWVGAPAAAQADTGCVPKIRDEVLAVRSEIVQPTPFSPELKPGVEPGTVDIDLNVKDKLPLHGSVELNNRYSADTTKLRLNANLPVLDCFVKHA